MEKICSETTYQSVDPAYDDFLPCCSLQDLDFSRVVVYVNCEPCVMCAAALKKLRVGAIFYGCANPREGSDIGFQDHVSICHYPACNNYAIFLLLASNSIANL